ncbi:uncharacterized protein ACOB8E_016395 isoform 2-T2 [Sarcophilus harrisii]
MYCISISIVTCFPCNFCWKKLRKITPISDVSNRLPIYTAGNGDSDPDPEKQESPRPSYTAPVAWGIPSFQRNPKVFPQGENDRNVAWQSSPKFWKNPKVAPQGQNHTHVAWGIPSFQRNPKVVPQGENDRNVALQSFPKFRTSPNVAPQGVNHTHDFCGLSALLCFTPQDLEDYTFV